MPRPGPGTGHAPLTPDSRCRFTKEGWAGAEAWDMLSVWSRLPPEEISRVTQIEMLDEQELVLQLFSHYCITLAWNDSRWAEVQL